jgi:hypothetical protein
MPFVPSFFTPFLLSFVTFISFIPSLQFLDGGGIEQSVRLLGYGLDNLKIRVRFLTNAEIFLFSTASRRVLGLTPLPIIWIPVALYRGGGKGGVKQLPSIYVEVRNAWSYTSTEHNSTWPGYLISTETILRFALSFRYHYLELSVV